MTEKELSNLRARTDAKLDYAEVHFDELVSCGGGGTKFERAHMESFFYHLLGARDAFLVELITYYSLGSVDYINMKSLQNIFEQQKKQSEEFNELYRLDRIEKSGWFYRAKEWRHHLTHVGPIRHHFFLPARDVELEDPFTGERVERRSIGEWLTNLRELLERLRESAIASTNSRSGI